MDFYEFLDDVEDYRRKMPCRDSAPDYSFKQRTKKIRKDKNGNETITYTYVRTRVATLLLYPDDNSHFEALKLLVKYGFTFACILHDSDLLDKKESVGGDNNSSDDSDDVDDDDDFETDDNQSIDGIHKKPHIHVVIYYLEARTNTAVAKSFGISSNYVKMFHNLEGRLAYLTHRDNVEKYQYSPNKVVGTLSNRLPAIYTEYGREQSEMFLDIIAKIEQCDRFKIITTLSICKELTSKGYYSLVKSYSWNRIQKMIDEHNYTARWLLEHKFKKSDIDDENPFMEL